MFGALSISELVAENRPGSAMLLVLDVFIGDGLFIVLRVLRQDRSQMALNSVLLVKC